MKKFLLCVAVVLTMAFTGTALTATVHAADPTDAAKAAACNGIKLNAGTTCGAGPARLNDIMKAVLNILSVVAGLIAVIMIIIGGIKYTTSGGDAQSVASAKRTVIYSVVGLIIVALSQFIVRYVLKRV